MYCDQNCYESVMTKFTDVFLSFLSHVALVLLPQVTQHQSYVSWEFEWPFNGQLCQKCLYQKL